MNHLGPWYEVAAPENKYQYNGKELNEELGLDWLDYGARWYDAAVGRFTGIDPIADQFPHVSPFNYAEDEPIANIDLHGLQRVRAGKDRPYIWDIESDSEWWDREITPTFAERLYLVGKWLTWALPSARIVKGANTTNDLAKGVDDIARATDDVSSGAARIGKYGDDVVEVSVDKLKAIHEVPRKGMPEGHVESIAKSIKESGFDLSSPVSATKLPDGELLVTGGHHRIAAMKQLGEKTIPAKIYDASKTDPVFLARMIGIGRTTGKYTGSFSPNLSVEQARQVNAYLRGWRKNNPDQVKKIFNY
jgi:RHS repeat-associated protein